ncbi:MAG TPA: 50S ribosomal protein L9 [Fimbriimonadaceae bacterium]|nr:50S ribosomal protein L9 [Fimbriimonadaceae bacterium]
MKVILNQTVPKVGKEGSVVTVADGFARNYLFPRGLAILADKKQLGALDKRNARIAERTAGLKAAAEQLREKLNGQTVRIEGKVGRDSTKLFGAITSQDVIDAIKSQLKIDVEKKQVAMIEPIRRLGEHEVEIDLHREVEARVHVHVFDPNAVVEEQAAPAAEVAEPEAVEA